MYARTIGLAVTQSPSSTPARLLDSRCQTPSSTKPQPSPKSASMVTLNEIVFANWWTHLSSFKWLYMWANLRTQWLKFWKYAVAVQDNLSPSHLRVTLTYRRDVLTWPWLILLPELPAMLRQIRDEVAETDRVSRNGSTSE